MAKKYTKENEVYSLIETRFPEQQYALFPQVADETGANHSRWADAVAFGLWPSRGIEIHGFEIKVSRGDWLNELNNHAKSSSVQRYCHRWWIVAGARDIVKPDELPKTWGLLIPRGNNGTEIKVQAPLLKPKSISRKFCAAIMRRASESFIKKKKEMYSEAYKKASESAEATAVIIAKREIDEEVRNLGMALSKKDRELSTLKWQMHAYKELESLSGIDLKKWPIKEVARSMAHRELESAANNIDNEIKRIEGLVETLKKSLDNISTANDATRES